MFASPSTNFPNIQAVADGSSTLTLLPYLFCMRLNVILGRGLVHQYQTLQYHWQLTRMCAHDSARKCPLDDWLLQHYPIPIDHLLIAEKSEQLLRQHLADLTLVHLRLIFSKPGYEVLAGEINGRKNRQKNFRSIFNVAHCAAPCCIFLLPNNIDCIN